jgi:predicted GNAT family acetyltransferase
MTNEVRDNTTDERFELKTEEATAFIAYHLEGEVISLDHTEVPSVLGGKGIGSALVKGTLDILRDRGQKLLPRCSFVRAYIERHPEYRVLLAE